MSTAVATRPVRVLHELTPAEAYIRDMKRLFEKSEAQQQRHQANVAQEAKEIHERYFAIATPQDQNGAPEQQPQS